jgi:hypothetical protein
LKDTDESSHDLSEVIIQEFAWKECSKQQILCWVAGNSQARSANANHFIKMHLWMPLKHYSLFIFFQLRNLYNAIKDTDLYPGITIAFMVNIKWPKTLHCIKIHQPSTSRLS